MSKNRVATLDDLLSKKIRVKTASVKIQQAVTENMTGIYKIPSYDKPFSIFFINPTCKVKVNNTPKTCKENTVFIIALLSDNPNYTYLQSCKVGNNPKTYWLKDNSKVTVICTLSLIDRSDVSFVQGTTFALTEEEIYKKLKYRNIQ